MKRSLRSILDERANDREMLRLHRLAKVHGLTAVEVAAQEIPYHHFEQWFEGVLTWLLVGGKKLSIDDAAA